MNIRDYLCQWLGCKADCNEYEQLYRDAADALIQCSHEKADLKETIRQLELLVPRPTPPKIDYIVEKDTAWVQQVIDGLGLGIIRIPLDAKYYLTNRKNFLNIIAYDWVDSWKYIPDVGDCDKSAVALKSHVNWIFRLNQVGIVIDYGSGHAYILVIYANGKVDVLEPQTDGLYLWTQRPQQFYPLKGAIVLI